MPCYDGVIVTDRELYEDAQRRLNELTALFCATMKDAEETGALPRLRGDAQAWWKEHQVKDAQHQIDRRAQDARERFMMLSLAEQERLLGINTNTNTTR